MILCLFMYIPQVPYKTTNYLVEVLILNERGKDMNRSLIEIVRIRIIYICVCVCTDIEIFVLIYTPLLLFEVHLGYDPHSSPDASTTVISHDLYTNKNK